MNNRLSLTMNKRHPQKLVPSRIVLHRGASIWPSLSKQKKSLSLCKLLKLPTPNPLKPPAPTLNQTTESSSKPEPSPFNFITFTVNRNIGTSVGRCRVPPSEVQLSLNAFMPRPESTGLLVRNPYFLKKRPPACVLVPSSTPLVPRTVHSNNSIEDILFRRVIGQGSFAVVREGFYKPSNERVAIKTYEKHKLCTEIKRKGVFNEIKIIGKLEHPNVVKFLTAIETARHIHIVMEYISGKSLYHYMKTTPERRLSENEAQPIFCQILRGLQTLHSNSIVHRDVKLQNLLITPTSTVKLIDFGFSGHFTEGELFCGTPSYMAPEIVNQVASTGGAADIWASGVLLYKLLTGYYPFEGKTEKQLFKCVTRGLFSIPGTLSESVRTLIAHTLQTDPALRPTTSALLSFDWVTNS